MSRTLAIMVTMTTYGMWLRGDRRGWVDAGRIFPPDVDRETADRQRMTHPPFTFDPRRVFDVGTAIAECVTQRLHIPLLALTAQTWHVHFVIAAAGVPIDRVVQRAKQSVRWRLRPEQPIWTTGYDKRFCFDAASVINRVQYVERHNTMIGLSPRPYPFITDVHDYLAPGR